MALRPLRTNRKWAKAYSDRIARMLLNKRELAAKAIKAAHLHRLDAALVCSIIQVASNWDATKTEWKPSRWLLLQHPLDIGGFDMYKILGTRWGLMQVSGEEAYKLKYPHLDKLSEAEHSLDAGCLVFKHMGESPSLWFESDASRAQISLALKPKYQQFTESA